MQLAVYSVQLPSNGVYVEKRVDPLKTGGLVALRCNAGVEVLTMVVLAGGASLGFGVLDWIGCDGDGLDWIGLDIDGEWRVFW